MATERPIEGEYGPEAAPQGGEITVPEDPQTRRKFLTTLGIAGAGAGAAATYGYGREAPQTDGEMPELLADDPEHPEEEITSFDDPRLAKVMLQIAEDAAAQIARGDMELSPEQEQAAVLAMGGMALASPEGSDDAEAVTDSRITRRGLVSALMGGTLLLTASQFAKAQERGGVTFIAYNYNSNARNDGEPDGDELRRLEVSRGRRITLEEFTRMNTCMSPRAARLYGEHKEVEKHNEEVKQRKKQRVRDPGEMKESPIEVMFHLHSKVPRSSTDYEMFKLAKPVRVNGKVVEKHYAVARVVGAKTRPYGLILTAYLGSDLENAKKTFTKLTEKV